ncbi:hypothetical protein Nepgr_027301 [Nepenthes gracilis]|uniref:J domain-containing protein n=1 Tax=Nepenthes gracilis TaxID=150966 RepID=A0AAD3T8N9_NEPGR|nr:hypothetical protein Nepgr_027301 [Nepenthes gracilis]
MFRILSPPSNSPLYPPMSSRSSLSTSSKSERPAPSYCRAAVREFTDAASLVASRKPESLYEVLRIKENASPNEIKTAYRSLAKLHHPDASPSDGSDFIEIHNAYETLSDPASRDLYDLSIGLGRRDTRLSSSSFGFDSVARRPVFYTTRRWETDQCW